MPPEDRSWFSGWTVAGLFAGIGGLELGLGRAGHRCVLLCEIDESAQAVLEGRFSSTPLVADIRDLEALPSVNLVAAGFPCQDLSQAGCTQGNCGGHSSLVEYVFRPASPPNEALTCLLFENVPFMLHLDRRAAFRFLVSRLERLSVRRATGSRRMSHGRTMWMSSGTGSRRWAAATHRQACR